MNADVTMLAKELYALYKEYDYEMFRAKILKTINRSSTVLDLFRLYDSH